MPTLSQLYLHLRTHDNLPATQALYRARLWLSNINYFNSLDGEAGHTSNALI